RKVQCSYRTFESIQKYKAYKYRCGLPPRSCTDCYRCSWISFAEGRGFMIKINLLEVEKERRAPKPGVAVGAAAGPTTLIAALILGLTLGAFLIHFFIKRSQLSALQKDVAQKRERKKELEPYIKRVDELERRRNELAKKNYAIEELRSQ